MTRGKQPAIFSFFLVFVLVTSSLFAQEKASATAPMHHAAENKLALHEGWTLQTSAKVEAKGDVISTAQFSPTGWHQVTRAVYGRSGAGEGQNAARSIFRDEPAQLSRRDLSDRR